MFIFKLNLKTSLFLIIFYIYIIVFKNKSNFFRQYYLITILGCLFDIFFLRSFLHKKNSLSKKKNLITIFKDLFILYKTCSLDFENFVNCL